MSSIEIQLNGESKVVAAATVEELLQQLNLAGRKVAVELNREVVARTTYAETKLAQGDQVEVIHFVGGG